MTIADKGLRFMCFALIAVILLGSLCSCGGNKNKTTGLQTLNSSVGVEVKTYHIILPSGCGAPLVNAAVELAAQIESRLGVATKTDYDTQSPIKAYDAMPIYIGNSAGLLDKYIDGMRAEDYIYRAYDEFFLLGGYSDNASVNAINRFLSDVLPLCETKNLFEYEGNFSYTHTYELTEALLCGFDVGEFDFCLPFERQSAEGNVASALHDKLVGMCGATSGISFSSSPRSGVREIVFETYEGEDASLYYDGEDVVLKAPSAYGFSLLAEKFYSLLLSGVSEGKTSLDLPKKYSYSCADEKLSVAVYLPSVSGIDSCAQCADIINSSGADIFMLGKLDRSLLTLIENRVAGYTFVSASEEDQAVLAFAYKTARLSCTPTFDDAGGLTTVSATLSSNGESFSVSVLRETSADSREENIQKFEQALISAQTHALGVFVGANSTALDITADGFDMACALTPSGTNVRAAVYESAGYLICSAASDENQVINISASKIYSSEYLKNIGK